MATAAQRNQIRLLIPDNSSTASDRVFTDAEIDTFFELEDEDVRMAAAQGLDTIANDMALTYKHIEVMDVIVNAVEMAKELRYRANDLRARAAARVKWTSVGFNDVRDDEDGDV